MRLFQSIVLFVLCLFSISVLAAGSAGANSSLRVGGAFDMGLGVTAQYKQYSFFFSGDAAAFDVRVQNFQNDKKTINFYIDVGGFVDTSKNNRDDRAGVRVPLGVSTGFAPRLQGYIQAVPSFDLSDTDFDLAVAAGVRYTF